MIDDEKYINDLVSFGLTHTQAKVYLTLEKLGRAPAKTIAKNAQIARQDVYAVLEDLQQLGVIQKIIDTPTKFEPFTIKECLTALLARRNNEIIVLTERAKRIIHAIEEIEADKQPPTDFNLTLLSDKKAVLRRAQKEIAEAKKEICIVTTNDAFNHMMPLHIDLIQKALDRDVNVKVALEKTKGKTSWSKTLKALSEKQSFQIKYTFNTPKAIIGLFDDKLMFTTVATTNPTYEFVRLWSDQPSLIELARSYFEMHWKKAKQKNTLKDELET
jgi:sugar-specific transcriptional regulator TrmB